MTSVSATTSDTPQWRGTVVRMLAREEAAVLDCVADGVFDDPIDAAWCAEFFADPRHHIAVALDGQRVIGMATGVHYLHPDKPAELLINEVGVAEPYRNCGVGRRMLDALLKHAVVIGCEGAWVLTEASNAAARKMYQAAGGVEQRESPIMIEFRI
jgi:ribosomal protein S18 acetylase RimI-like enzyme